MLCLSPAALQDPEDSDDDFGFGLAAAVDKSKLSARLWSPRFRGQPEEAPQCVTFAFAFEPQEGMDTTALPFALNLLRHSAG